MYGLVGHNLCSSEISRRFGRTYHLHIQSRIVNLTFWVAQRMACSQKGLSSMGLVRLDIYRCFLGYFCLHLHGKHLPHYSDSHPRNNIYFFFLYLWLSVSLGCWFVWSCSYLVHFICPLTCHIDVSNCALHGCPIWPMNTNKNRVSYTYLKPGLLSYKGNFLNLLSPDKTHDRITIKNPSGLYHQLRISITYVTASCWQYCGLTFRYHGDGWLLYQQQDRFEES
jgi:hypothetical protein